LEVDEAEYAFHFLINDENLESEPQMSTCE